MRLFSKCVSLKVQQSLSKLKSHFLSSTGLMRGVVFGLISTLMAQQAYAQTIIYQDDFEGVTSGWTDNTVEEALMLGTDFLGRFGDADQETMRTFTVPAGATSLEIEFDLLRFDSWDFFDDPAGVANDGFAVEINGTSLFSSSNAQGTFDVLSFGGGQGPRSGTTGNVDWAHVPINPAAGSPALNLDFRNLGTFDFDQIHRFTLTVNNPGTSVTLTLRANLDQDIGDESAGYDNFLVTAIVPTPSIAAVDESETLQASANAQPNVLNVIDNDAFDGVTPTTFDLSVNSASSLPPELTFDAATGEVGVVAGAPAGVYTFDYDICEEGSTTNCETATVTITIEALEILATAETFTPIEGTAGGVTSSVLASDTLDGAAVDPSAVTLTVNASDPELTLDPATGLITVAPNTPAGTYTVEYMICEDANPSNCSTAVETVIVEVTAAPNFVATLPTNACEGNFAYWREDVTGIDPYRNNRPEDRQYSHAEAFTFSGWEPAGDGTWVRPNTPAPEGTGVTILNTPLGDFISENNTPIIETTFSISRMTAEPNTLRTVTIVDSGGLEHQTIAAFDASGNLISTPLNLAASLPAAGTYTIDVNVPATGEFFIHVWKIDVDQGSSVAYANCGADLLTEKTLPTGSNATPEVGDTVSFEIVVTNNGVEDATNVSLTDSLPTGLTATNANGTVTAGSYDAATGIWTIGSLADGDIATLTLTGTVDAGQGGSNITNVTTPATSDQVDPSTVGDVLEAFVDVVDPQPSLSMEKVADNPGPHAVGDVITYTYTVTNNGNTIVRDIAINDTHNGSDPAPVPGNEVLLTDNGTANDSTDASVDGSWDVLAPGDVVTFTGTYTVTQIDVDNL